MCLTPSVSRRLAAVWRGNKSSSFPYLMLPSVHSDIASAVSTIWSERLQNLSRKAVFLLPLITRGSAVLHKIVIFHHSLLNKQKRSDRRSSERKCSRACGLCGSTNNSGKGKTLSVLMLNFISDFYPSVLMEICFSELLIFQKRFTDQEKQIFLFHPVNCVCRRK